MAAMMPLSEFSPEARERIERLANGPKPPPRWKLFRDARGRVLGRIRSRAWVEWNLRHGRKAGGNATAIHPELRAAVIARDGMICQLCGKPITDGDLHIDHIRPRCRGGLDVLGNLQAAHSRCNCKKGGR